MADSKVRDEFNAGYKRFLKKRGLKDTAELERVSTGKFSEPTYDTWSLRKAIEYGKSYIKEEQ